MSHAPHSSSTHVISGLGDAPPAKATSHSLPVTLDPRTYKRALDCVHCGLCLPACPTYTENGLEADSPRGRIYLMKGLADGKIELNDNVTKHLDLCLDCRACETACPSGVVYHELIEETRAKIAATRKPALTDRVLQWFFFNVFPYPGRLKTVLLPARLMQKIGLWSIATSPAIMKLLPAQFRKMQQMLPPTGPLWEKNLHAYYPAKAPDGVKRATIGMFAGCVGSVMFQHVNRQTIALLQYAGCDVIVAPEQTCCGAIHHHAGDAHTAEHMAIANIQAFGKDRLTQLGFKDLPSHDSGIGVDYIVNNIAGCGAMLKDYDHLLRDDKQWAAKAVDFATRSQDICQILLKLNPARPAHTVERTVTYHHACHLKHAQKAGDPPLELLSWIKGLKIVPLPEADMCCGAAGTYNLSQPEMAQNLAERKINHIQSTQAPVVVMGNVGCAMQIQSEANRVGTPLQVVHPVTLLYEAYFGA